MAGVDFERVLYATGGKIWDVYPEGQQAHGKLPSWCPYFDCDLPMPSGLSGGPVMTDKAGLCGLMSTSSAVQTERAMGVVRLTTHPLARLSGYV